MISKRTTARAKAKVAAVIASVAGKEVREKVAKRIVEAGDAALVKAGNAARKRQRSRTTKKALKGVGKAVLVTGAAAATVLAGRAIIKRRNGA